MAQISHREQLINGAIQCLQTQGYARTTARDIVAASGANLASIGYHFGSKQALLDEALIRVCLERTARIGESTFAVEGASPLERLRATFIAVTKLFEAHRPLLVAFVEAMAQVERSDQLREKMAALYRDTRRAAAEMTRASLGPAADRLQTDPEVFASFLIALFDGLVLQWILDSNDTPRGEELITSLLDVLAVGSEQEGVPPRARRSNARKTRAPGSGVLKHGSRRADRSP